MKEDYCTLNLARLGNPVYRSTGHHKRCGFRDSALGSVPSAECFSCHHCSAPPAMPKRSAHGCCATQGGAHEKNSTNTFRVYHCAFMRLNNSFHNSVVSFQDGYGRFPRWCLWPFKIPLKYRMVSVYSNHGGKRCRQSSYLKRSDSHLKPMLISQSKYFRHLKFLFDEQVSSWGQHEKYSKCSIALKYVFKFDQIIFIKANKNVLVLFTDVEGKMLFINNLHAIKILHSSIKQHWKSFSPKDLDNIFPSLCSSREERELSSREDIISRGSKKLTFEKGCAYKSREYPIHS